MKYHVRLFNPTLLAVSVFLVVTLSSPTPLHAKKTGYTLKTKNAGSGEMEPEMAKGSFMVASNCPRCNNGYGIDQISFSGFDKPQGSSSESFFITNGTDRMMTGITLYIEYLDQSGRMLHKQMLNLSCAIPPGETRQVNYKSWDRQNTFHYILSPASKRGGEAFTVRFDPVSFYLRY